MYARLERLRRAGVIRNFSIDVDHHKLGPSVTALVLVSAGQFRWREMSSELEKLDPEHTSRHLCARPCPTGYAHTRRGQPGKNFSRDR
ncbi:Lrp/AsnC family transcriptional regulator [Kitasatospora sp. NPDC058218]|uniref:Lrp/AsnC family transcriptional regulator n=1 Tax=Kitasatospora sp. NPDC058218 TaxID=3346385 RepID=UPI0036DADEA2